MCVVMILGIGLVSAAIAADTSLPNAVQNHDHHAVRALLSHHVDVNQAQGDGATALAWASHWNDLDTAALLIAASADVNAANDIGVTPLFLACENGSLAMAEKLLRAGANPNAVTHAGETVLMMAARTGNAQLIKALLARGAKTSAKETHGQTALMWAAAQKHAEAVRALLEGGADVNSSSKTGFTPLMFAAREGDLNSARLLAAAKANLNAVSAYGVNALLAASGGIVALAANEYQLTVSPSGHESVAIFLLNQGADPSAADGSGRTALHAAAETGKLELAKALLAHGADPNVRIKLAPPPLRGDYVPRTGFVGATPFWLAAKNSDAAMMNVLAASHADPGIPAAGGATPLMMAVGFGQLEIRLPPETKGLEAVKATVRAGAGIDAANDAGQTALHMAASLGRISIIQALAEAGADLNAKDSQGRTPLNIAENPRRPHPDAAALLRAMGGLESPH